jgi:hypothetical protein
VGREVRRGRRGVGEVAWRGVEFADCARGGVEAKDKDEGEGGVEEEGVRARERKRTRIRTRVRARTRLWAGMHCDVNRNESL